jgi:CBS domain-containing protein
MRTTVALLPPVASLSLQATVAEELMTANPVSIREDATVREAVATLIEKVIHAAPVINDKGRAVGVISVTDILIHNREYSRYLKPEDASIESDFTRMGNRWPNEFEIEITDPALVKDLMTPAIFTVELDTSVEEVVKRMLHLRVHHLFVIDPQGTVVGVISPLDVLRLLK